ncbi:MAG TPA: hypothetical protein VM097_02685 [Mycobacteriales bacterium]|nr:hypothetical protein [Mycobacteriales bacterium]
MVLHPVGPLPASTYWRRRLVLLAGIVVLLLLVKSCAGDDPTPRPRDSGSPAPSVTATTGPSPRPSPTRAAGPVTCGDRALGLTAAAVPSTAPAGSSVRFTVTVTNTSKAACRRDLGGGALEVLVYSGTDRIWSSDDCGTDTSVSVQRLQPGGSLESTVSWSGKRSARGCPASHPEARPGTYTVRARIGTLRSASNVFRLTG